MNVEYIVKGWNFRDGITYYLQRCETYKEAVVAKAAFQKTRAIEFPKIWIDKVYG